MVRTYAVTHPPNLGIPWRSFALWDQLAHASRGVITVWTSSGTWVVPPHRAVWIPAGTQHRVQMTGRVAVRSIFFSPRLTKKRMPRICRAVNVPPLLTELILHATRLGILRRDEPRHRRLAKVLLDQLETLPVIPLQLPIPKDSRARKAAELIQRAPGETNANTLTRTVGATKRTLERWFAAETGMTLGRWRRRARLIEALRLLAQGKAVTDVALDVGYQSPSAFIAAFRSELGTTPRRYFEFPTR